MAHLSLPSPRERLIVALDQTDVSAIRSLIQTLGDSVEFYKVGWVALLNAGLDLVRELRGAGKQVFLDLKLYDVPITIENAVRAIAALDVRFLTVHGVPANITAAVAGRGRAGRLEILSVIALTSLSEADVRELHGLAPTRSIADHMSAVARRSIELGASGVIASPNEVSKLRAALGPSAVIVTPGIRLAGEKSDDHQRSGTPFESIVAGADYLVTGRSIYGHPDPKGRVEAVVAEIERALEARGSASLTRADR